MSKYVSICFFAMLIFGCKKNPTEQPSDPCDANANIMVEIAYPLIRYPIINPENPDEIAFLRDNSALSCCEVDILVYNMTTKALKSIHTASVNHIEWGNNSWLFFDNTDTQKINKIKTSGDSLTVIGTNYRIFQPKFNYDRTAFLSVFYSNNSTEKGYKILSPNGNEISTIIDPDFSYFTNWHHDSLVLVADRFTQEDDLFLGLHSINSTAIEMFPLRSGTFLDDKGNTVLGSDWLDKQRLVVSTINGLYLIEYSGPYYVGSPVRWRETCNQTAYGNISVDRNGQKIMVERLEYEESEPGKLIGHNRFYRMNFDGSNEEVIEITGL